MINGLYNVNAFAIFALHAMQMIDRDDELVIVPFLASTGRGKCVPLKDLQVVAKHIDASAGT